MEKKHVNTETKRQARYRQKINFAAEKINDIPKKTDNPLAIDAAMYRIQTSIDAVMDIAAMLVKDKGRETSDNYSNIHTLLKTKVINKKMADDMVMVNGLRNAIVHKYNSFEEDVVIDNISEIKRIIKGFLDVAEIELKTIFKRNKKGTEALE
ncbi:MAG: DUF86 domain-containing protein [Candidatus Aenigmarchaeota archaeon]|nr:DUF86 domain-containing protein [Candidatus Aenigmarchaeota archaeon]MDI6723002.1 DUF86 domain-containing protein [Candidatus Aenigmarchaeota archaeon]